MDKKPSEEVSPSKVKRTERVVRKQMSMEAQEVADLPDFLSGQSNQKPKQSAAEMLAEIKRKEELKRVNEKFGKQGAP